MARRPLAFVVFFVLMAAAVAAVHYYIYQRMVRAPRLGPPVERVAAWAVTGLALAVPATMVASRFLAPRLAAWLAWPAFVWLGLVLLLLFLLAAAELVRAGMLAGAWLQGQPLSPAGRLVLARLLAAAVLGIAVALAAHGIAQARAPAAVRSVRVLLPRLPARLSGFRLVQLTDLHLGPTLGRDWLAQVVARTNALGPDVVAITGDLAEGPPARFHDEIQPLGQLSARYGVFFVTGNHEYYNGPDAWARELTGLGIRVLRNERVAIGGPGLEGLDLAGVENFVAFGPGAGADLGRALRGRDERRELVLLAHEPRQIHEAVANGVGLQLSGHTHGGQIFPWSLFVRLQQPAVSGLAKFGATQLYVSRGTGYWGPPMRIGAPAEITVIELFKGEP